MKNLLFCLFGLFGLFACNEVDKKPLSSTSTDIRIGSIDSVFSEILGEQRKIWVHVPNSGGNSIYSKTKYPVIYLLDGDAHFYSVMGMMRQLSTINGNTVVPEMIIVAIPNTDRTRDLTPTHVEHMDGDSSAFRTSGGGEKFTRFMADELMPYIEKNYPTAPNKTLIGHSFGGLLALNILIHHKELFANYIAIDPSLWWDERKLLTLAETALANESFDGKSLFVGVANTMGEGMDTLSVQLDTSGFTDHIRSILHFSKLAETSTGGLNFDWKYYPDDTHGSVPLISEYDGLRFLFSWYDFRDFASLFQPDSITSPQDAIKLVTDHYQLVSNKFGYEVLPPESFINGLGYGFLSQFNEKSRAFFELNIKNFPESSNVYDSMGDYYLAQGDTTNAIKHFEKSIAISESTFTREKLNDLKK